VFAHVAAMEAGTGGGERSQENALMAEIAIQALSETKTTIEGLTAERVAGLLERFQRNNFAM
jgi:hypothetical protein